MEFKYLCIILFLLLAFRGFPCFSFSFPLIASLLKWFLQNQARGFQPNNDDDSDDDYSDDEELQSPIDEVDPFIFFIDTIQAVQISNPARFQNLTRSLDFHYQALASGIAQHAEQRKVEIEKEKLEKTSN